METCSNSGTNVPDQYHTLYLPKNRELLAFGYIRHSSDDNVPLDVSKYLSNFFDNAIVWNLNVNSMNKFYECKRKEVIYGPQFQLINGMICELTLCPKGWSRNAEGFCMCFLEIIKFPNIIRNIIFLYT